MRARIASIRKTMALAGKENCPTQRRETSCGQLAGPALILALLYLFLPARAQTQEMTLRLHDGWTVQSSEKAAAPGEQISRPGFDARGWYKTTVPGTVVGALAENRMYPDPYFGMNLRSYPGMQYAVGENFSHLEMPADSPFAKSWWYRTEFHIPAGYHDKTIWLGFHGINYRANIWLNGTKIADESEVAGAFRRYEFDITRAARPGEQNVLAVEVFAPKPNDLAITWVDWNPAPPDKNMGVWQEVTLEASGPVSLRHPFVQTKLELPSRGAAHLTVGVQARNAADAPVHGVLRGRIEGAATPIEFSTEVQLAAGETRDVLIAPEQTRALNVHRPALWWPYTMGKPYLHTLDLRFILQDGSLSDRQSIRFGIEQTDAELTPEGHRLFKINGRPILIRGGGWAGDMLWRPDPARRAAEFRYVKEMGLNTIRLEGKLEDDDFFDLADREGILVMAGWCCCDHWEKWGEWNDENRRVSVASLASQVLRLRRHPSVVAWLNGSDNPPTADVERAYLDVLQETNWPKPVLSSATQKVSDVTGATGVKMTGPYDYVPPNYWLSDTKRGGAFGFNTETSPGPAPPPVESLEKMLPAEKLWPINEEWNYHAGGGQFRTIDLFTKALEARYGKAKSLEDFSWKSQAVTYEGERAMFEAFGRNKYHSTGVIQWMLNNAWPGIIWHLYDCSLRPAGGYFGAKKALAPLHIQYSYDDASIVVVNEHAKAFPGLRAAVKVYDTSLRECFSKVVRVDAAADNVTVALFLPKIADLGPMYFLRLDLFDSHGASIDHNFYWLSAKSDVLDWDASNWYYTPLASAADLTALQDLPKVRLKAAATFGEESGGAKGTDAALETGDDPPADPSAAARADTSAEQTARVTIHNPEKYLAFLVRLRVMRGTSGEEVLPAWWEDNYFELWPGETREIAVHYRRAGLGNARPVVRIDGWNVLPSVAE